MAVTTGDEFVIPISVKDEATAKLKMIQSVADSMAKTFTKMANDLNGASSKVQESAGKMRTALKGAGDGAGSSGGMFTLFGKNIGSLPSKIFMVNQALELITRTFRTFATLGTAVMGPAIALEKGAATINAIVPDFKDAQKTFSSDIINFQRLFGTSQQDIIEAYYKTLSSGIVSANDATKFLYDAQRLAIGGSTDLSVSVRALTSVIAAYNMKASDAARISDILTLAERNGQATMTDLALTIGDVAPLAYNMGVSLGETASALSAMTTAQQDTGQAMTYLRSILVSFMKQSELLGKVLPTLKIDGKQFSGIQEMLKSVGLLKTMKALIEAVGGQAEAVGNLIGRQEGIQGLITMIMNPAILGVYEKTMAQIKATEGIPGTVVGQAVDIQMRTVDRKLMILKGTFTALIQDFGYKLLDVTARLLTGMREAIDAVYPVVVAFAQALQRINWDVATKGAKEFGYAMIFMTLAMSGALLVMARFTLLTMTVFAFATAIEYVYRNFGNLGEAFEYIVVKCDMARNAFEFWVESIKLSFVNLLLDGFAWFLSGVTDFMAGFVGLFGFSQDAIRKWSDEVIVKLKSSGPDLLGHKDKVQTLNDEYAKLNTRLNELRKTVQTPFVFTMSDNLTSAMKDFNADILKNGTALDAFFNKLKGSPDTNAVPGKVEAPVAKRVPYVGMSEKDINSLYKGTTALTKLDEAYLKVTMASLQYNQSLNARYVTIYGDTAQNIESRSKDATASKEKYHKVVADTYALINKELIDYGDKQSKIDAERAEASGDYYKSYMLERDAKSKAYDEELSSISRAIELQKELNKSLYNTDYTRTLGKVSLIKLEQLQNGLIEDRKDMLEDFDKKDAASKRKTKIAPAVERGGAVFSGSQIEQAGANFGAPLANGMAKFTSYMGGPMGMMSAAGMIMDAVKGMINAIAEFPQKILDVLDAVSSFPGKVEKTILSAPKVFGDLIGKGTKDSVKMVQAYTTMIPDIISKMLEEFINTFSSEKFWSGLGKAVASFKLMFPKMILAIIKGIIAFVKNIGPIISAMVKGFIDGFILEFKKFINDFVQAFGLKKIFNIPEVTKQIEELGASVSRSSEQLFSVMEDAQKLKGSDIADKIKSSVSDGFKKGTDYLKMWWNKLLQYLKDAWLYVWEKLLKPFCDLLKSIWDEVIKAIQTIWDLIAKAWDTMIENLKLAWDFMIAALRFAWDVMIASFKFAWDLIVLSWKVTWEIIKVIWDIMVQALRAVWDSVKSIIDPIIVALQAVWDAITPIFDPILKALNFVWDIIVKSLAPIAASLYAAFLILKAVWDFALPVLQKLWTEIESIFKTITDNLSAAWTVIKTVFDGFFEGLFTAVSSLVTSFYNLGKEIWSGLWGKVVEFWVWFSNIGKEIWSGLWGKVVEFWAWFSNIGKEIWSGLWGKVVEFWEWISNIGKHIWDGLWGKIVECWTWISDIGKNIWSGLWGKIVECWEWISNIGKHIWDGLWGKIVEGWEWISNIGKHIWDGLWGKIVEKWEKFTDMGKNVWSGFWNSLVEAWDNFYNAGKNMASGFWDNVQGKKLGGIISQGSMTTERAVTAILTGGLSEAAKYLALGGPIYAAAGTFVPGGTDTVPAMLTPGEFVINRNATRNNLGLLHSINNGGSPVQSSGGMIINVTINSKTLLDAEQIRREVVPEIEKELKKKSQMGRYILSSSGVR